MARKRVSRQLKPENIELIKEMQKKHPRIQWGIFNFTQTLFLAKALKELPGRIEHHLPWSKNTPAEKEGVVKQTYKILSEWGARKKGQQELFPVSVREAGKLSMVMLMARRAADRAGLSKETPLNVRTFDKIKVQFRAEAIRMIEANPKQRRWFESASNSAVKTFFKSPDISDGFKEKVKRAEKGKEENIKKKQRKKKAVKRRLKSKKKMASYTVKKPKKPQRRPRK